MSENLKALWDNFAADMKAFPQDMLRPESQKRLDELMAPVYELLRQFEREREHQPFSSQARCPICSGTVTFEYRAPLVGSMKCDRPECVAWNL